MWKLKGIVAAILVLFIASTSFAQPGTLGAVKADGEGYDGNEEDDGNTLTILINPLANQFNVNVQTQEGEMISEMVLKSKEELESMLNYYLLVDRSAVAIRTNNS